MSGHVFYGEVFSKSWMTLARTHEYNDEAKALEKTLALAKKHQTPYYVIRDFDSMDVHSFGKNLHAHFPPDAEVAEGKYLFGEKADLEAYY